ncbi:MAG: heparan-alpha-glucosaminide N-acetyltransferase domain-containing protein [Myxococcota bacterium]
MATDAQLRIPRATPLQAAAALAPAARWLALDLFRFVAVVLMIQGHVFYEVAGPSVREASWYGWHGYVHGFTAPIFLFSSGMAFGITTLRKWRDHTRFGKPVYKRLERYFMLIAIGYGMHFSTMALGWLQGLPAERLAAVTRVDALQHIGVALLIAESLALLLKRKAPFFIALAVITSAAVLFAPALWNLDVSHLPIPVAAWVNASTGSIFPFAPWCGYLFAGVLTARFVRTRLTKPKGFRQLVLPLALLALGLFATGKGLTLSGFDPFGEHNYWKTSPYFFLIRLGGVMGLLAVLCAVELGLERRRRSAPVGHAGSPTRVVRFVQIVGQQTLVLYVAHLMLLYGTGVTPGVVGTFHRNLNLAESAGVVGLFFVAMGLLAYVWHWTKKRHFSAFEAVRYSVTALLLLLFFLR